MIKFLITYKSGEQFGIEIDKMMAIGLLAAWFSGSTEEIDVDGYGFYPADACKVELFDLV
jgi:hypothetical protein